MALDLAWKKEVLAAVGEMDEGEVNVVEHVMRRICGRRGDLPSPIWQMGMVVTVVITCGWPSLSGMTTVVVTPALPTTVSLPCPPASSPPHGSTRMSTGSHCSAHQRSYRLKNVPDAHCQKVAELPSASESLPQCEKPAV